MLFGYEPTPARVRLRPRPRSWRLGGALRRAAAGVLVAPLVGLVPPHAPWAVGALAGGAVLARRRWNERYTVEDVDATCPRCGGALHARRGRLRMPHPVPCEACHHECALALAGDVPGDAEGTPT